MRKFLTLLSVLLIGCSTQNNAMPSNNITFKQVSFNQFMGDMLNHKIPLNINVPSEWVLHPVPHKLSKVLWIPENIKNDIGDNGLPKGEEMVFLAKLTPNVGFDGESFYCGPSCDESKLVNSIKRVLSPDSLNVEKIEKNGITILFVDGKTTKEAVSAGMNDSIYMAYFSTMVGSNTVLITLRSGINNLEQSKIIWSSFKSSFK